MEAPTKRHRILDEAHEKTLIRMIVEKQDTPAMVIIANLGSAYWMRQVVEHTSRIITWWAIYYGKEYRPAFNNEQKYKGQVRHIPLYRAIFLHLYGENDPDYQKILFAQTHQVDYDTGKVLPPQPIDFFWMLLVKEKANDHFTMGINRKLLIRSKDDDIDNMILFDRIKLEYQEDSSFSYSETENCPYLEMTDTKTDFVQEDFNDYQKGNVFSRTSEAIGTFFAKHIVTSQYGIDDRRYDVYVIDPGFFFFRPTIHKERRHLAYRLLESGWFFDHVQKLSDDQKQMTSIRSMCLACGVNDADFKIKERIHLQYCSKPCYDKLKNYV